MNRNGIVLATIPIVIALVVGLILLHNSGFSFTPVYKGQAEVTNVSLTLGAYLATFSLTIKNTGNLPITSADYMVANYQYQSSLPIIGVLMPEKTVTGGWQLTIAYLYQVGMTYPVTIQITYNDGSTSTIQTSVIAR